MSVTIELPPESQARLEAEAGRRGMTVAQLVAALVDDLPGGGPSVEPTPLSFIGVGRSGRHDLAARHREIRTEQTAGRPAREV